MDNLKELIYENKNSKKKFQQYNVEIGVLTEYIIKKTIKIKTRDNIDGKKEYHLIENDLNAFIDRLSEKEVPISTVVPVSGHRIDFNISSYYDKTLSIGKGPTSHKFRLSNLIRGIVDNDNDEKASDKQMNEAMLKFKDIILDKFNYHKINKNKIDDIMKYVSLKQVKYIGIGYYYLFTIQSEYTNSQSFYYSIHDYNEIANEAGHGVINTLFFIYKHKKDIKILIDKANKILNKKIEGNALNHKLYLNIGASYHKPNEYLKYKNLINIKYEEISNNLKKTNYEFNLSKCSLEDGLKNYISLDDKIIRKLEKTSKDNIKRSKINSVSIDIIAARYSLKDGNRTALPVLNNMKANHKTDYIGIARDSKFKYIDGVINIDFHITKSEGATSNVHYQNGIVRVNIDIPETMLAAIPGKKLIDIIDYPLFKDVVIKYVRKNANHYAFITDIIDIGINEYEKLINNNENKKQGAGIEDMFY